MALLYKALAALFLFNNNCASAFRYCCSGTPERLIITLDTEIGAHKDSLMPPCVLQREQPPNMAVADPVGSYVPTGRGKRILASNPCHYFTPIDVLRFPSSVVWWQPTLEQPNEIRV